jgi:isocitrate/isopropylmalate dehydrogenase
MYEPVHGSAFDIAGRGVANPIGMVLSVAMMLDDLDAPAAARAVRAAVEQTCRRGILTPDVGGSATTAEVAAALLDGLSAGAPLEGRP